MNAFSLRMTMAADDPPMKPIARMRAEIEDMIERLFVMLDKIDGDPDAEDDGTAEPSLGWTLTMATGNREDLEEDRCYF